MKKYLLLTCLPIAIGITSFMAFAQDTTLPQGNSRIHLYSGKTIKHVKLWKIDTSKVEYVIDGNLGDVKTSDVMKIETHYYLLTFDDDHHLEKRHYDCIIPYYGDTLWGIIQKTNKETILFIPAGSTQQKTIMQSGVKSYLQWDDHTQAGKLAGQKNNSDTLHSANLMGNNSNGVNDSVQKKQNVVPPKDDYYQDKNARKEETKTEKNNEQYYLESYQRGVKDAVKYYKDNGWSARGFFLGMTYGSPYLIARAANSKVDFIKCPLDVDTKLYKAGYESQTIIMRTKKAAAGASVAKVIITVIVFMALLK